MPTAFLRRTKIVATLGPATDDPAVLADMVARRPRRGAHQLLARHARTSSAAASMRARRGRARRAAMSASSADLAGPKIRIESFRDGAVHAGRGRSRSRSTPRSTRRPATIAKSAAPTRTCRNDVRAGDTLLLNDGQIVLEVDARQGHAHRDCVVTRRRRAVEPQGRQPPGRRHLGAGADRQGPARTSSSPPRWASTTSRCRSRAMRADIRRAQRELRKWRGAGARRRQDRAPRGASTTSRRSSRPPTR